MAAPGTHALGLPVEDDVACHGCGYNLRGQSTASACPECNAPVWISAAGESLRYAEPQWLTRIIRGANAAMVGFLGTWLGPVVVMAVCGTERAFAFGFVGIEVVAWGWLLWGLWHFSAPEPRGEDTGLSPRKWIRVGVVAVPVTFGLMVPAAMTGPVALAAVMLVGSPFGLVGVLAGHGYARYLQQIARRLDDFATQRWAAAWRIILPVTWTLAAVIVTLTYVSATPRYYLVCIYPPLFLVALLVMNLPLEIFKPIRRALHDARRNWSPR